VSFDIVASGAAADAVRRVVPGLVEDLVASRITAGDVTLWGADAEDEAGKRLGWTEAVVISQALVPEIVALRESLHRDGVNHILLAGMGGSSLAPEVITRTNGIELTILDSTAPGQVLAALQDRLASSALVVSSKSGSTVETDSQLRVYVKAFQDAGVDPVRRIVVVTDPGSPLDTAARQAGYRVFNADPNVGGRYSALTAFGLVPCGLAGVDIQTLLDEASSVAGRVAVDLAENPALVLAAAIAGGGRDKLGLVPDGTYIVGFADWAEQLIAESTGKLGKGILPVVLDTHSPELGERPDDLQIVRLVESARATEQVEEGEIEISGTLGAQFLVWEYAVAVAGRILGINPFDQPDVESAKSRTRGLLESQPEPSTPAFDADGIEVRASATVLTAMGETKSLSAALDALLSAVPVNGYVAVQAYADRVAHPGYRQLRDIIAEKTSRPVTFGWGPRFLHSTGQFHKGGPAVGVFLQLTEKSSVDLDIPDRPFTFGQLIQAQAAGDAGVLADAGRPVLTLTLGDPERDLATIVAALKH
jgi:glucose-6-phosphate isomerase